VGGEIYQLMLEHTLRSGPPELSLHILRTAVRVTAVVRNKWLAGLWTDTSPGATSQSTSSARPISLLLSARWFELTHAAARRHAGGSWVAEAVRQMASQEMVSLAEEHEILSSETTSFLGLPHQHSQPSDSALHPSESEDAISSATRQHRPFPYRFQPQQYLSALSKTRWCLHDLVEMSLRQRDARRLATKITNQRLLASMLVEAKGAEILKAKQVERLAVRQRAVSERRKPADYVHAVQNVATA
jgi:hypothetical protein